MTLTIRPAAPADLEQITDLLLEDAKARCTHNAGLWKMGSGARDKTHASLKAAMEAKAPPFRQQWMVADDGDMLVGVTHTILLPVPPIYAGEFGPPGLIMEDCFVAPNAPPGTKQDLINAAETDLIDAGARILLASSVDGGPWERVYAAHGYQPITQYFAKTGLTGERAFETVRPAHDDDVPSIVAASARHRHILNTLHHLFWKPHPDADTRFGAWMARSLTLKDRDMFVSYTGGALTGYAISQPATQLHFPTPHDISGVGVIDDFYHEAFEDPAQLGESEAQATVLFSAAESARAQRGDHSVLVVCPAAWPAKAALLKQMGYDIAITWHIKMMNT